MFADQLTAAVASASLNELDCLAQDVWRAHGAGQLDDDQAQELAERIQKRRPAGAHALKSVGGPLVAPKRYSIQRSPEQRSPDRQASLERRRQNGSREMFPDHIRAQFTQGERAVLAIVADEVLAHGVCDRSLNELAARAGVCRSIAKRAIYEAEAMGLISVQRRPRSGRKHLTNLVRIICADWIDWLNKGSRRSYAVKACVRAIFGISRGVQIDTPRSQVFRNRVDHGVGNSVKKEE
jgi:hypothetical protein